MPQKYPGIGDRVTLTDERNLKIVRKTKIYFL